MTKLLEQAFQAASRLSVAEQDLLAHRLLAELAADDEFDRAIARTPQPLVTMAHAALEEYRTGATRPLDAEDE